MSNEKDKRQDMILDDSALEKVSGGKTAVPVDKKCPLCKRFHEVFLVEYANVSYKRKWVRGAMKFVCNNTQEPNNYFYELKDGNKTVYLDINFGILD